MSDYAVTIDLATLSDDPEARHVEFDGEASGDTYRFAICYDTLEALAGRRPDGDALALARAHVAAVCAAAAHALARAYDRELVIVSENDLA